MRNRRCKVCEHVHRESIEYDFLSGDTVDTVCRRWNITELDLNYHARYHRQELFEAAKFVRSNINYQVRLRLFRLVNEALDKNELYETVKSIEQLTELTDAIARLQKIDQDNAKESKSRDAEEKKGAQAFLQFFMGSSGPITANAYEAIPAQFKQVSDDEVKRGLGSGGLITRQDLPVHGDKEPSP